MTTPTSRRRLRIAAIVALLLVPLAVVGLFAGALSSIGSDDGRIPAAIVNEDQLVQQTAEDGTETPVLAGRLLVTELTGKDSSAGAAGAFDWSISGKDEAADALARGDVYAVLTIPKSFSSSIVSLSSADPKRGTIAITTDDAHGYLTGVLTDAVGDGLAAVFGNTISEKFIAGLVGGTGQFKDSLDQAASGAAQLQSGASGLASALGQLRDGASATQQGAAQLAGGIGQYTGGVSSLSSNLGRLSDSTEGLQELPQGVSDYTSGVSGLSQALAGTLAGAPPTTDPVFLAQLQAISDQLGQVSGAGPALVTGARGAASAQTGISQLATGAARLDSGSGALSGATGSLSQGLSQLVTGLDASASGAQGLAGGAGDLASGLTDGSAQVPTYTAEQTEHIADVAASPVGLTTERRHEVSDVQSMASTLLVPVGLWIGAFAVFLALGLFTRRILASTASSFRITRYALTRAGALVLAQAVLLVVLLHGLLGVPWTALPATLPFALLVAVTVTCIHALLTAAFGRWGLIVSLVLLALQLASTGGLYPIEVVPTPFQAISPLLPVTQAVDGMQSILTGLGPAPVIAAALQLAAWAAVTAALTVFAVSRKRSARYLGFAPAPVPAKAAHQHAHLAA
ncbi:YhgE/Pip domain-containing protein [Naasia aerilata]|uniref:ABC transporter n=1 Tax=Naasia aerilata TaxID=1162966 RepID=A0ABN6XME7_9MICO|nr:YhgE/Pip family protein [Naasia aerilata]BDZ46093.1 ABC transporter [Naasia aerilata]